MVNIYGTLDPNCKGQSVLADMFRAGMTGTRVNLFHESLEEYAEQNKMLLHCIM